MLDMQEPCYFARLKGADFFGKETKRTVLGGENLGEVNTRPTIDHHFSTL